MGVHLSSQLSMQRSVRMFSGHMFIKSIEHYKPERNNIHLSYNLQP